MLYKHIKTREELLDVRDHMAQVLKGIGFNPSQNSTLNEKVAELLGAKDWNTACGNSKVKPESEMEGVSTLDKPNFFNILGLGYDATDEQIQFAWEQLALEAATSNECSPSVAKLRMLKRTTTTFEDSYQPVTPELNFIGAAEKLADLTAKDVANATMEMGCMSFQKSSVEHEFSARLFKVYGVGLTAHDCYTNILNQALNVEGFNEEDAILRETFKFGMDLPLSAEQVADLQVSKVRGLLESSGWSVSNNCGDYLDLIYYQKIKELGNEEFRDIEISVTVALDTLKATGDWREAVSFSTSLNDGEGSYNETQLLVNDDKLDLDSLKKFESANEEFLKFKLDEVFNNTLRLLDDNFL
ncbi:hypothetical protein [Vibrio crassostreae]|uniref:hypothetical protein n=1 Tax=Vibrio crassostreae TaxID=246167 RepID=UPI001B308976|nr:hypothetical protein [Vibrio crassostreae]